MSKSVVVTTRIEADQLAELDRLAAAYGHSRSWVINRLLSHALCEEMQELDAVEAGLADIEAGRTVGHDEVMAELDAMIASRRGARDAA